MNDSMQQAMRLMRGGDLVGATRVLQQRLAAVAPANDGACADRPASSEAIAPAPASSDCIEGEFRVVEREQPVPAPPAKAVDAGQATFRSEHFSSGTGELDYKLFVPAGLELGRAPLLVMLHGCTQSADDFAVGTRMNALAGAQGYVVAYPQQSMQRNRNRCWNWFRGGDQQREKGEPALLAALTRHLVVEHGLDARRVYVAGLSAGGAMAAVLASTHPDLFAAIGVHSGLPIGLASDVPSAFAAMRTGKAGGHRRRAGAATATSAARVPAIVFHGDGDTTVHPHNGLGVVAQSLGGADNDIAARATTTVERGVENGGRQYTRTRHLHDGRISAEHWLTHGAAHAWSGGDPAGSYTDPSGPDASEHMLRFFAEQTLRANIR
ncbi:MAG: PHB depolymerase family esterase [Aquimonas sp.]|nr:PHB depolymerase family esterase [Aquimonas sp.]